ncbi:MAG: hypothetical protein AMXMBFR12_06170 [Candidatus Babeliales bacterium]
MLTFLFYLCTFIFSLSIAMEKPLQKTMYASKEIVSEAVTAVTNDHLKCLKVLLETYIFEQKDMKRLLRYAMGSKQLNMEFMGAFVLLLQHGAPADFKDRFGHFDEPEYEVTLLEYAKKEYPSYVFPLQLFGAKPLISDFGNQGKAFLRSQTTGRPIPLALTRQYLANHATTRCRSLQEAVRHEDINALKLLLAKQCVGNHQEKDRQLCFAVDAAISLNSTEAIDELAKYGAPIAERLNLHFLFHPEVIEHCARNKYITLQDLGAYKTRIPENRIGSMWTWTQQQFEAHIARLNAAINSAMRFLERQELQEIEAHKKARVEKKDE